VLKNLHNASAPIGTGPFKWGEWGKGDHVTMVRNDQYFRTGQPYLDRVIAKVISDPTARVLALRAGDIDYIQSYFLPKQDVAVLAKDPRIQIKQGTDLPGNFLLFLNVGRKPLDLREVRQALAIGLNRDQILKEAVFGLGTVGKSAIHHELTWAYDPAVDYTKMYPYDPGRAAAMLDKAGLRPQGGTRFRVRLVHDVAQAGFGTMAQIIRDNWQKIGVEVVLEPVEFQLMLDRVFNKRDYDVALEPYTTAGDPAIGIARAYITTPPGRPFTNPSPYSNPQVDRLFEQATLTPSRAGRQKQYFEVQKIIANDLPVLNLIDRTEVDAASANFRGLWVSAEPYDLWGQVSWVKGVIRR
jgi:peptide/nickel transport system substrate-binding protein